MQRIRKNFLVFGKPTISEEDIEEVIDTLRSGWIGTGPKVVQFEESFWNYIGSEFVVAVNSCTAALSLALEILEIGPGDEVITTPITFPSTANVIVHRGAKPVFVDVEKETGNISVEGVLKAIGSKTRAIIPVHLAGRMCAIEDIASIAQQREIFLIEDAAHALETTLNGRHAGTFGDFGAFSFYPTKSLTTGEGGMLITDNEAWAEKAKLLRLHGISSDAWARFEGQDFQHYETYYPGYKYNLSDLQAALGIHQFDQIEKKLTQRKTLWNSYNNGLKDLPGILLPPGSKDEQSNHARHLYSICIEPEEAGITRDQLMKRLRALNIGTGIHFTAIHLHKYYKEQFDYVTGDLPNAEWISSRTLSLPLMSNMSTNDVEYVVEAVEYSLQNEI